MPCITNQEQKLVQSSMCMFVQMVTAGALLLAMRRPLPKKSIAAGWLCEPRLQRVPLQALTQMLAYAGPICIVLLTKTFIYSTVLPSAACLSAGMPRKGNMTVQHVYLDS